MGAEDLVVLAEVEADLAAAGLVDLVAGALAVAGRVVVGSIEQREGGNGSRKTD